MTVTRFGLLILFGAIAGIEVCYAQTSLYLPGFDPQPLSVNVIGVGGDGETTYQVVPGEPTGTWVGQEPAFYGTATLVEGPDNALISYANPALGTVVQSCTIVNGEASCSVNEGTTTEVDEELATPFLVQGGGTISPAATSAGGSVTAVPTGSSASPASSPSGSAPTGAASTPAGASPSSGTTHPPSTDGCVRSSPSILVAVLGVAGIICMGYM